MADICNTRLHLLYPRYCDCHVAIFCKKWWTPSYWKSSRGFLERSLFHSNLSFTLLRDGGSKKIDAQCACSQRKSDDSNFLGFDFSLKNFGRRKLSRFNNLGWIQPQILFPLHTGYSMRYCEHKFNTCRRSGLRIGQTFWPRLTRNFWPRSAIKKILIQVLKK